MGDYVTAGTKLQDALRIFRQLNASDETILTLLEIAGVKKAAGQNDKASEVYSLAKERAMVRGDGQLAQAISDLASGKVRSIAKRTAAGTNDTLARSQRMPTDHQNTISHMQSAGQPRRQPDQVVAREEIKDPGKAVVLPTPEKTNRTVKAPSQQSNMRTDSAKVRIASANPAETHSATGPQDKKKEETTPLKIMAAKDRAVARGKPVPIETKVGGEQAISKEYERRTHVGTAKAFGRGKVEARRKAGVLGSQGQRESRGAKEI